MNGFYAAKVSGGRLVDGSEADVAADEALAQELVSGSYWIPPRDPHATAKTLACFGLGPDCDEPEPQGPPHLLVPGSPRFDELAAKYGLR